MASATRISCLKNSIVQSVDGIIDDAHEMILRDILF